MQKQTITKDDGRYLIYYTFPEASEATEDAPTRPDPSTGEAAAAVNTPAEPVSGGEAAAVIAFQPGEEPEA